MTPLDRISQLTDENAQLRAEIERLENLTASGIHTCHADCQRPTCVLRRERDKALAELERVTAERDNYRRSVENAHAKLDESELIGVKDKTHQGLGPRVLCLVSRSNKELAALRARVAELEHQLKSEIDARNGWWDNCKQAEQRNAELEEKAERYRLTTLRQDARIAELCSGLLAVKAL